MGALITSVSSTKPAVHSTISALMICESCGVLDISIAKLKAGARALQTCTSISHKSMVVCNMDTCGETAHTDRNEITLYQAYIGVCFK